jgi:hypothetical protein
MPRIVLRLALALGGLTDLFVATLMLFFQSATGPILDIPTKDPASATFVGCELVVVALVYLALIRDPVRFRPLLYIVALDQVVAAAWPVYEVWHGDIAGTWRTLGPIPFNLALVAIYLVAARVRGPEPATSNRSDHG